MLILDSFTKVTIILDKWYHMSGSDMRGLVYFVLLILLCLPDLGESVSVIKHTDPVPDPRAVNQDKKNMLFSVRTSLTVVLFGDGLFRI